MLNLGRNLLVWVLRHLLALVLILLILIAGRYALPPAAEWVQAQYAEARRLPARRAAVTKAQARFADWSRGRSEEAEAAFAASRDLPADRLRARRAEIGPAIAAQGRQRLGTGQLALAAASGRSDRIFGHYRAGAEIALLERERRFIDGLLAARSAQGRQLDLASRREEAVRELRSSYARWQAARARVERLNRRPLAGPRNFLCRNARPQLGCTNYRALEAARSELAAAAAANRSARRTIAAIDRSAQGVAAARAAVQDLSEAFEPQRQALAAQLSDLERASDRNWILWIRQPVVEMLPTALLILAGVILGPVLIKALLYFLVAPIAARRPPIRLVPGESGEAKLAAAASAVAQRIALEPGQEILVVPEAVQSTPHGAAKRTQWLLSWRMPLSSLASGLIALVRVRSEEADFVLVSATGNPLAEVAPIELAPGAAMVVRPRALRGIVQRAGRPMRITRHWRIARLSAWLTLQFRYLVLHGPCTLIVQGTRGVRLEPARGGRGINQAATIGFSAGLAYSVRRSEAFGAYLMGRQELFNDSFAGADGWYLYEEMPREGEKGGLWGRGVRGVGDALLKLFGL